MTASISSRPASWRSTGEGCRAVTGADPRESRPGTRLATRALLGALDIRHIVVLARRGSGGAEEAQLDERAQHALDRAILDPAVGGPLLPVDDGALVGALERLAGDVELGSYQRQELRLVR